MLRYIISSFGLNICIYVKVIQGQVQCQVTGILLIFLCFVTLKLVMTLHLTLDDLEFYISLKY